MPVAMCAIVLASLGILANGFCGIFGSLAQMSGALKGLQAQQGTPTMELPQGVLVGTLVFAVIKLLLWIAWLVGGVGLIRMSPWARRVCISLSILQLAILVLSIAFQAVFVAPAAARYVEDTTRNDPRSSQPGYAEGRKIGGLIGAYGQPVCAGIVVVVLPIWMLIVLRRPDVAAAYDALGGGYLQQPQQQYGAGGGFPPIGGPPV